MKVIFSETWFKFFYIFIVIVAAQYPSDYLVFGGLFEDWTYETIDAYYYNLFRNDVGVQHKTAYIMAVNEINNKYDGLYDNLLPNTTVYLGYENAQDTNFFMNIIGADYLMDNFGYIVNIVIGPGGNNALKNSAEMYDTFEMVQIGYNSGSSIFSDKDTYKRLFRVNPEESIEGYVISKFIAARFGWSRVVTFSSTDTYGNDLLSEFVSGAASFEIDITKSYTFDNSNTDFKALIENAKTLGAYIFVFLMSATNAGMLLEQGYEYGLFKPGTLVIGSADTATASTWQVMSTSADIPIIMKGFFAVKPYYRYSDTSKGRDFVKRYRNLLPTVYYDEYGDEICDYTTDDSGLTYLWQYDGTCFGQNSTSFAADGSDLDMYNAFVYDATIAAAHAFHYLLYEEKMPPTNLTSANVLRALQYHVSFDGLTGAIDFLPGSGVSKTGHGERATDNTYALVNFNSKYYQHRQNSSGMATVLKWNSVTGFLTCEDCESIIYSTADNSKPYDRAPETIVELTSSQKYFVFALGLLSFLIVSGFTGMIVAYRNNRIIRASQPAMLLLMLVGGFIGAAQIITIILEVSTTSCIIQVWLAHLSFGCTFCALIVKTWVVNKIVNSKLKKVKVRVKDAMINVSLTLGVLVILLLVITFVSKPHLTTKVTSDVVKPLRYYYCSQSFSTISTLLLVLEFLVILVGLRLCWNIRNVPDALNESKFILGAVGVIVLVAFIDGAVKVLGGYDVIEQTFILNLGFAIAVISCMCILFGNKAWLLWIGAEFDGKLQIVHKYQSQVKNFDEKEEEGLLPLQSVEEAKRKMRSSTKANNHSLASEQIDAGKHNLVFCERTITATQKHLEEWKAVDLAIEENRLEEMIGISKSTIVYDVKRVTNKRSIVGSSLSIGTGSVKA